MISLIPLFWYTPFLNAGLSISLFQPGGITVGRNFPYGGRVYSALGIAQNMFDIF